VIAAMMGCGPGLPRTQAEGERVAVGTQDESVRICAGTLAAFDQHVAFVENELQIAVSGRDPLRVHVVADPSPWCDESIACYIGGWVDGTVVSSTWARPVWHELVHHVVARSDVGMTDRFLSEGLASALGDDWCPPAPVLDWERPALRVLFGRDVVPYEHYPVGARFVEFVRHRHGTPALVELARCVQRGDRLPKIGECVEAALGTDLDMLTDAFRVAPVERHANPALCRGPIETMTTDAIVLHAELGCDAATTLNTFEDPEGRETWQLVDVPDPGMYRVAHDADGDVDIEVEPCFCPAGLEPLRFAPSGSALFFAEAGVHRIVLRTIDPAATQATLHLARP
jgi:hypothetical protein